MEIPSFSEKVWRPFLIRDLFEVFLPCGDTQADKCEAGDIPLISAGSTNNGICKFIKCGDEKSELYEGNLISVDMFGQAFFHVYKFYCVSHGRVNLLKPRRDLNRYHFLFICTSINTASKGKFSYNQMCSSKRVARLPIQLPVNDAGAPDYDYMETYMRAKEEKILQRYREYVKELELDAAQVPPLKEKVWRPFRLLDYFNFVRGDQNDMTLLNEGDVPIISAKNNNNGYKMFVNADGKRIFKGHFLTINNNGDGGAGIAYYQPADVLLDIHVTALIPKIEMSRETMIFLSRCITNQREKFGFGYTLSNKRLNIFRVMLPVNDAGEPDFEYMENYIRAIEARQYKNYLDYIDERL